MNHNSSNDNGTRIKRTAASEGGGKGGGGGQTLCFHHKGVEVKRVRALRWGRFPFRYICLCNNRFVTAGQEEEQRQKKE